jgi:membrane-associated protease RseP (regulator of RpoE activity)
MGDRRDQTDLQSCLAEMVTLEHAISAKFGSWEEQVSALPHAASTVDRLRAEIQSQQDAIEGRRQAVGGYTQHAAPLMFERRGADTAVGALQEMFAAFAYAAFGYAKLHAVAHRFFDRTTADLAEKHMRAYAGGARALNQLVSPAAVDELLASGQECQCHCPACGIGVCACADHGTATVEDAWRESAQGSPAAGVLMRAPRSNSAAALASLHAGDIVLTVDDQQISSISDLQNSIQKHGPGEELRIRVQRGSTQFLEAVLTRPQAPS